MGAYKIGRTTKSKLNLNWDSDEEVIKYIEEDGSPAKKALAAMYKIFRERDKMSVQDALLAALNHAIDIYEKGQK